MKGSRLARGLSLSLSLFLSCELDERIDQFKTARYSTCKDTCTDRTGPLSLSLSLCAQLEQTTAISVIRACTLEKIIIFLFFYFFFFFIFPKWRSGGIPLARDTQPGD